MGIFIEILVFVLSTAAALVGAIYCLATVNLFWTIVREGEIKVVMAFRTPVRAILRYKGYHMEGWEVKPGEGKLGRLRRVFGGIAWVGIPPFRTIYRYLFRWATVRMSTEEGEPPEVIIRRERVLDYIFAKLALYVLEVEGVETKGMVPLNLRIVFTACCTNPYKALFAIHDWLITLANLILPHLRVIVAGKEFEALIRDKITVMKEVKKELQDALGPMTKRFENDFGILIAELDVSDITPTNPQHAEIAIKEWAATQEAKAKIAAAQGTKQATITEAEGQKQAIILTAEGEKEAAVLKGQGRAEALELVARRIATFKYGELVATIDGYVDMGKNGKLVIASGLDGFLRDIGTHFGKKQADLMEKMFSQLGMKEDDFMNFLKWKLEQKGGTK